MCEMGKDIRRKGAEFFVWVNIKKINTIKSYMAYTDKFSNNEVGDRGH